MKEIENLTIEDKTQTISEPIYYHVCFSPNGKTKNKIIKAIKMAENNIKISIAFFTDRKILAALTNCKKINITILLNFSYMTYNYAKEKNTYLNIFINQI